jgi:hypothetical protein
MINKVKNYRCENSIDEVWKQLRHFCYGPYVLNSLKQLYPKAPQEQLKKQVQQIGFCIRQAEEYFKAAKVVDLATKPLLLYYGAVSLSNALILVKKDGTHSIDFLRKKKKHKHHGLDIIDNIESITKKDSLSEILKSIKCQCHFKDESVGDDVLSIPWGNFPLFYESLVETVFSHKSTTGDNKQTSKLIGNITQICTDKIPLSSYKNFKFDLLSLFQSLPDLHNDLKYYQIPTNIFPGGIECSINKVYNITGEFMSHTEFFQFFINGLTNEAKQKIKDLYISKNTLIKIISEYDHNIHFQYSEEFKPTGPETDRYFPDIIDDIHGELFYIIEPENHVIEPANYFIILFCLGMLSRYYPDVWMKLIDTNKIFAELIKTTLNAANRKFPNLILDQLTNVKHKLNQD